MTPRLGNLLEEIAGISPRVLGERNLARAVRERMSACNLANSEQYLEKLRSSAREMEALIEAVVTPETSFFRDRGPFTFLDWYVRNEWNVTKNSRPLRVLSAPCSSGEEPYSVVMVFQDAGLKPDEYYVDALDISRSLIRKAEQGVYTRHAFRGVPASIRDRYFVPAGHEHVLKDTVRHSVHFVQGNLLDQNVFAGKKPYDIVFCRNLLIYLGAEARSRVVKNIESTVAQNGLLFVGHAETSCVPAARFASLECRGTFGFRKVEARAAVIGASMSAVVPEKTPSLPSVPVMPDVPGRMEAQTVPSSDIAKSNHTLEAARQSADQGRLSEAAAMCERLLLDDRMNADAYCLLGTVLHGLGNLPRAEECFTRALYLDERCYDAAVHLSLIKEYRGDSAGAEVMRQRAARIRPQTRIL